MQDANEPGTVSLETLWVEPTFKAFWFNTVSALTYKRVPLVRLRNLEYGSLRFPGWGEHQRFGIPWCELCDPSALHRDPRLVKANKPD